MLKKMIAYSLDPKIPLSQIEKGDFEYDIGKYQKLSEWIEEHKVCAIIDSDKDFHYKLLPIRPKVRHCYYIGDLSLLNKKILGIVGPRMMSNYGKQVLENVFSLAPKYDLVTISGMAEGVDQCCHRLSSDFGIPTIAVLGWGIGYYMKRSKRTIIEQIVANGGLVLSEYKLWEKPTHYTFPQRNRLIAGLADVLFLPEAGEKSGSLITVDYALSMKKPVYATPNSIFSPTSFGILQYLEKGYIKPILNIEKLFSTYFPSKNIALRVQPKENLTDEEQSLLSVLSHDEGVEVTALLQTLWETLPKIIQLLTMLEIKGCVRQERPGRYLLSQ